MKVRDLMYALEECDPEAEVHFLSPEAGARKNEIFAPPVTDVQNGHIKYGKDRQPYFVEAANGDVEEVVVLS